MISLPVFITPRLQVYKAIPDDAAFYHRLWTHPRVMKNVGFPWGLPISLERIFEQLCEDHFFSNCLKSETLRAVK